MLYNNYRQALKIIETNTLDIQHILKLHDIDEVALGTYILDERDFFATLEKESDGDLHAITYVEFLQELWSVEAKLDDVSTCFQMQMPTDYHFISPNQSYAINLSQICKTDTAHRQLKNRCKTILIELLDFEHCMNIDIQWMLSHTEYKKTADYITNCKYEKALDNLHTLVIKCLFELYKLNLSQTVPIRKPMLDWTK
ncbi:hypothetical protein C0995_008383, partial [Termitomyces sp. Mi166